MKKILIKIFFVSAVFFILSSFAKADTLGEHTPFFVDSSYDSLDRSALVATLQEVSARAYFYAEDDWWNSLSSQDSAKSAIHLLAAEFDQKIYPKLIQVYGSLWEPGIDNDYKVTILISRIKEGAGGYFHSADEYQRNSVPTSNEREMIYLNSSYFDTLRAKSFLAHEFQHLITFYQKDKLRGVADEVWLNEARSEYASTLVGYDDVFVGSNLEKRILDFYKDPSDSLTEWTNVPIDYGSANLFMQYLVSHFGNQILTKMVQNPYAGIASINEALKQLGFKETLSDIFFDWTAANYLNDCKIEGQKYCYLNNILNEKLKVSPTVSQLLSSTGISSISWTDFVKDWSGHWYKFSGGNANLKLSFKQAPSTTFKAAYIIQKINGSAEIKFINLDASGQGTDLVENFGTDVSSVTLVPVSVTNTSGFGISEPFRQFSYQVNLTTEAVMPSLPSSVPSSVSPNYPDGSLIRAKGDYKVYVLSGGYKRWIQNSEIFKFYPHFGWQAVIEATPEERDWYRDDWLVRADGDLRVYEINGDGTKHWLNMTAEEFSQTGRIWDMVYIINNSERDFYKTGADVMFR